MQEFCLQFSKKDIKFEILLFIIYIALASVIQWVANQVKTRTSFNILYATVKTSVSNIFEASTFLKICLGYCSSGNMCNMQIL